MRYIRFIAAFVALVVSAACTNSDIDDITPINPVGSKGDLQIVGRITQYSDCEVATRSKKEGDESKVTSMGLALFPIEGGTIGNCLYYDFKLGGSIVFIVDRHDAVFNNYVDKQFAMYIFANMQDAVGFPKTAEAGVGKSLDYFTKCAAAASTTVKNVPANGFPMVGSLGNTVSIEGIAKDGKTLILKPAQTDANVDDPPLVDGKPTDNLEIPLKSMYAKFSFTISVDPDQEIVGNKAPRFDLLSYEVNNIPETVDSNSSTNDDNAVNASSGKVAMGNYAQGATKATFDFYLPERYLSPSKKLNDVLPDELKKGTYGTDVDADQNGYRDEDERYHQRFKNKLVEGQAATYVTIAGKYTDHQGHSYDVDYNIYLGDNNTDNFDVIRNKHYDNSITIRGISASDDQATNTNAISIDWRVNVNRSTPLVINLRRESLLDAHFEVRPLRLRLVGENIPTGTSATVSVLNQDGTSNNIPAWIRLEASGSTADHITSGVSAGKRKYFTTDLVTNTLAGNTTFNVNNLTRDNQTLWIYVDENTTTTSRAAIVRVSYDGLNKDYKIVQHGLHKIKGANSGKDYYIEQYEEYLYNYDAEDSYGQTKDEGMPWGLENKTISSEHRAFSASGDIQNWLSSNIRPYYDFYIKKYDSEITTGVMHEYAGLHFTEDIVKKSNNGVKNLTMDQSSSVAVEYCYNRNKRNADGSIAKVEWYLPSADELEDFIVAAYNSFKEFQDNYYWTSQPAYIRNFFYYHGTLTGNTHGEIYVENKDYARATKVNYEPELKEFYYSLSGLNKSYEGIRDVTKTDPNHKDRINMGWYYEMPYYDNLGTGTYTTDQWYQFRTGGSIFNPTYTKYYVHLGHLYDLAQDGYHKRTQNNRVRCVRKL